MSHWLIPWLASRKQQTTYGAYRWLHGAIITHYLTLGYSLPWENPMFSFKTLKIVLLVFFESVQENQTILGILKGNLTNFTATVTRAPTLQSCKTVLF